ncbi:TPA: hypothetical protein LEL88_000915 [Vibrio cholerae]|uniref:Uncharacterized protein n=2 Tax=Vibrio cholerae TaxID=666 RepID=A0A0H6J166_VIBCL|nr:hypothetical protein [Vibrio cholerae]EAZ74246.1 conserved hypothetical protein [Vibrio cholerae NCTC 8457]EYC46517.1 hypothetical protein AZ32_20300 [Vibrio cholerae O1 biovar El Tor str. L-3226]MDG6205512.1 hypothetical protein [Vibrio sp. NO3-D2]AFC58615.1 hypothetical protein O3Y_08705 [Vibrio cholerae IEC224]AIT29787.1 hypothetical protein EN18_12125 [Vibrio cholerae]
MNNHHLSAAESHELATRVSALGAKQVLLILRQIQDQSLDSSMKNRGLIYERALRTKTEAGSTAKIGHALLDHHTRPH